MNSLFRELDRLLEAARRDESLRRRLLDTRAASDPMDAFCSLAQSLGWNASFSGRKVVLSGGDRQITLAPWLRCQADGVTLEQTAPVLPLDEALYLPLDDLCAALGAALERTPGGDYLITPA